jgi:hypothetical protein
MKLIERAIVVAIAVFLFVFARNLRADDAEIFNDYLKYSQEIAAKHHLIVHAHFDREGSKAKPIDFRYDRYPELERMQLPSGASYVRKKKDGKWIKSDDWGETGNTAPKTATRDFDNWIGLIDAPLMNIGTTRDKSQGAVKPTLVENDEDAKPDEIRFILTREHPTGLAYPHFGFTKFQDKALLHFYGGAMRLGEERLEASIGYDFMFLVNMQVVTPTPSPSASQAATPTGVASERSTSPSVQTGSTRTTGNANAVLNAAMKKMERGSWEVDETMVGNKTIHVHGLINGKDFDLTSETNDKSPPVRQITISILAWISRDNGKTWKKMSPVDRTIYDWAHTAAMAGPRLPPFEIVGTEEHDGETWQHLRMKTEEKVSDESLWHYWIALDPKGEPLAVRQFQGGGIVRGEVMSTKGTYRPSKESFIKPPGIN